MVNFGDDGFTIEVKTQIDPVEEWINTHEELVDALQNDIENKNDRFHYLQLLKAMMPNKEVAQKMVEYENA